MTVRLILVKPAGCNDLKPSMYQINGGGLAGNDEPIVLGAANWRSAPGSADPSDTIALVPGGGCR